MFNFPDDGGGDGGKGCNIPRLGEGLNAGSKKNAKYLKIISLKENKLLGLIQVYTLNSFFFFCTFTGLKWLHA